jgi:hypothetical protein
MEKTIYDLKLHETLKINNYLNVMRVAGGWIYSSVASDDMFTDIFVPYSEEFKQYDLPITIKNQIYE